MSLARDQIGRAEDRLRDARTAFHERRLADATRYSQEALELALKAALRSVAVEVPKRHDVAPELSSVFGVLPKWFAREIPTIKQISFELAQRRSLAMYGDERTGRPANELFVDPLEVERYLMQVDRAVKLSRRLIGPNRRKGTRARRSASEGDSSDSP
ncbi:MAG: HEPN domain-containing protein [Thermoplasmata archaeon]